MPSCPSNVSRPQPDLPACLACAWMICSFTYDAHVHPEFTDATGLLVSYDVNTFDPRDLLSDVDSYRPRFIRVKIGR